MGRLLFLPFIVFLLANFVWSNNDLNVVSNEDIHDLIKHTSEQLERHRVLQHQVDTLSEFVLAENVRNGKQIKLYKEDIDALKNEIKFKDAKIEALQRFQVIPESCQEIANHIGSENSANYLLDFDGKYGEKPVEVFCDFQNQVTKMGQEMSTQVNECAGRHCLSVDGSYENLEQARSLIEQSDNCEQEIRLQCQSSPINVR